MDPLDFLENEDLLRFFHSNKTELSCMVNPQTFLNQLRDHNLILEDMYKVKYNQYAFKPVGKSTPPP